MEMARLIDADKLDWWYKGRPIRRVIDEAPTVDAVPVVHGRWVDVSLSFTHPKEKCSVCGGIVYACGYNYCPNCGARMDGDSQ